MFRNPAQFFWVVLVLSIIVILPAARERSLPRSADTHRWDRSAWLS